MLVAHWVFSLDIRRGPHHDLRHPEVVQTVRGWLQAGIIWGCGKAHRVARFQRQDERLRTLPPRQLYAVLPVRVGCQIFARLTRPT